MAGNRVCAQVETVMAQVGDVGQEPEQGGVIVAERHVRFNDDPEGGWLVTGTRALPIEAHTTTREGAVDEARKALQNAGGGTLYIHEADDSVQQEQTVD